MRSFFTTILATLVFAGAVPAAVHAEDINLLPKFGAAAKTEGQKAADAEFIATIGKQFNGDRQKAAEAVAQRGWRFLQENHPADAMRRFNQAWLLDSGSGAALWGMAVLQAGLGGKDNDQSALALFAEAERALPGNIDFAADYARGLGVIGARSSDQSLLRQAFGRFAKVDGAAPQHVSNLQNWAITLYYTGDYAQAWRKIKQAEAAPRHAELDQQFIALLQTKMPRPQN